MSASKIFFNQMRLHIYKYPDGMQMSKVLSVRIDETLFHKINTRGIPKKDIVTKALQNYLEPKRHEKKQVSALKEHINQLVQQTQELQWQKNDLEIDTVCLKQENRHLQSRINDLAELFPSASPILGKIPNSLKFKKRWISRKK
jgi:hypothetical protein